MKYTRIYLTLLLVMLISIGIVGCTAHAGTSDLMDGITPRGVSDRQIDETFVTSMANFSIALFQESIAAEENALISPLSVMLALSMTSNGADGNTLAELEALLGGGIPLDVLNEYLYSYINGLSSTENAMLRIANSIWLRDDESLRVEPAFLQTNADFYRAQILSAAFDGQTVDEINAWVDKHTDGMIDRIIEEITDDHMLFLINAIAFDAEWARIYNESNIREGEFTNIHGSPQRVEFMHSTEFMFLDDGMATGFVKPYAGGAYSFVALLPNEGITVEAYIESLTGSGFLNILENTQFTEVHTSMPKFEFEYEISMIAALNELGVHDAFDTGADFSRMGTSSLGNLFIDEVLHKTFISVDARGTRAGAATVVEIVPESAPMEEPKMVRLNRPFVFAIVDNATNLPLFIGTVLMI